MSKTIKVNMQDTTKYTDALLDFCKRSETELDYEYAKSLLESNLGKSQMSSIKSNTSAVVTGSKLPKLPDSVKPVPSSSTPISRQKQTTTETGSKIRLEEQMNKKGLVSATSDVLDLQGMSEKFAEAKSKILQNKLGSSTRDKLLKLIAELEESKHLNEKEKASRVADWLNNHTSQPQTEMCGFNSQDPFQLRKFVCDIRPRMSASDTNITLGKRKRGYEDCGIGNISSVYGSSSDTRVFVHADWSRPRAPGKHRRVRE